MSATTRAFGRVDIIENILLSGLSTAEVTRARRINSLFKKTIDYSRALRRVLFLSPSPSTESHTMHHPDEDLWTYYEIPPPPPTWEVLRLHPAIKLPPHDPDNHSDGLAINPNLQFTDWHSGMWESMFICQPHFTNIRMQYTREIPITNPDGTRDSLWQIEKFVRLHGPRLGDLMDAIEHLHVREEHTRDGEIQGLIELKILAPGWWEDGSECVRQARVVAERVAREAKWERDVTQAAKVEYEGIIAGNKWLEELLEERMAEWFKEEAAAIEAAAAREAADEADKAIRKAAVVEDRS